MAIDNQPTSQILKSLPNLKIIAEFVQIGNIYMAPNFMFLYDRPTKPSPSIQLPIFNNLDQQIHIGMMKALHQEVNGLDALITEIVATEQTSTSVSQVEQSACNYVNLMNNLHIEVNLLESEQKDILIAPAIDEDAQKEAAHDSGASSTLIGFRDLYHDYKEQIIPIKTAGNTIYAAGIGSVGILQNVIYVHNLQLQSAINLITII